MKVWSSLLKGFLNSAWRGQDHTFLQALHTYCREVCLSHWASQWMGAIIWSSPVFNATQWYVSRMMSKSDFDLRLRVLKWSSCSTNNLYRTSVKRGSYTKLWHLKNWKTNSETPFQDHPKTLTEVILREGWSFAKGLIYRDIWLKQMKGKGFRKKASFTGTCDWKGKVSGKKCSFTRT